MIHTFLRRGDALDRRERFDIGVWVPAEIGGASFWRVATVGSVAEAMQLTNYLNGGEGKLFTAIEAGGIEVPE